MIYTCADAHERGVLYACDAMSGGRDGWMSSSGCAWVRVLYEEEGVFGRGALICVRMMGGAYGMCRCGWEMCGRDDLVFSCVDFICGSYRVSHVCVSTKGK